MNSESQNSKKRRAALVSSLSAFADRGGLPLIRALAQSTDRPGEMQLIQALLACLDEQNLRQQAVDSLAHGDLADAAEEACRWVDAGVIAREMFMSCFTTEVERVSKDLVRRLLSHTEVTILTSKSVGWTRDATAAEIHLAKGRPIRLRIGTAYKFEHFGGYVELRDGWIRYGGDDMHELLEGYDNEDGWLISRCC